MKTSEVQQRRAIEALRSGVPNRDAVRALGSTQRVIETSFVEKLRVAASGQAAGGLLVAGDFGTGKSHLLEYLQHRALEENFVVSKVVISKETPLHDPAKVFRSAIADARLPNKRGEAVPEIAAGLRFESRDYAEFYHWTGTSEARLDQRFAATLFLYQSLRNEDQEFADRIIRFWSGDPITVSELKKQLKLCNEGSSWTLPKITVRELALQRLRFMAALMRSAGYAGWVVLLDELELIGRYSLLQRGRSYSELARWVTGLESEPLPGVAAVLTMAADFGGAVLHGAPNDVDAAPNRLRARGTPEDELTAARAEKGIRIIEHERLLIERPGERERREVYETLKQIHGEAFGWSPPDVEWPEELGTRPMRQYVRSWIHEWDLRRLDPAYRPRMQVEEVGPDYGEDTDLETPGEPGTAPDPLEE